jgi:hypothetical protein
MSVGCLRYFSPVLSALGVRLPQRDTLCVNRNT